MSRIGKLVDRFLSNPKDFTWQELVTLLAHFGYHEHVKGKTGGSRRRFVDRDKNVISLHKPHPGNILKSYMVREIIEHLKDKNKIQ